MKLVTIECVKNMTILYTFSIIFALKMPKSAIVNYQILFKINKLKHVYSDWLTLDAFTAK